jgi:hypothetical protein
VAKGSLRRHSVKHASRVTALWHGRQVKHTGSAPSWAKVTIGRNGAANAVFRAKHAAPAGSHRFAGSPGKTYTLTVVEHDLAGQTSARFTTALTIPKRSHQNGS